jgi:hypothetical protein
MPVHIYLGKDLSGHVHEYKYRHEVEGFRRICSYIWDKLHYQEKVFALIANLRKTGIGRELTPDLVIISELGLGIMELKHSFGVIDCGNPNGAWRAGPIRIKPYKGGPNDEEEGGSYLNPHKQIQDYARQVRQDLLVQKLRNNLSIEIAELENIKVNTAICFTNLDAILAGCKEAVRIHYRPDGALEPWENFSVLTPVETPEWAAELRFEINQGPANWYRLISLSADEIPGLAKDFFGGTQWKQMTDLMLKDRKPFAFLELVIGGKSVQIFRLEHEEILIGRDQDYCQVVVSSRFTNISRKHARIIQMVDGIFIEDIGNSSGTFVDGVKVDRRIALNRSGQLITLGGSSPGHNVCTLRFQKEITAPAATSKQD